MKIFISTFRNEIFKDTKSRIKKYTLLPKVGDEKGAMVTITANTESELNKTLYNICYKNKNIKLV